MKKYENIPLFQFGMNENKMFISQQVVEDCLHTFPMKPVFVYDEFNHYIKENKIIGFVERTTKIENNFVYGDIITWSKYLGEGVELNKFRNYEINAQEHHNEEDIMIVDKFMLFCVSFDMMVK